MSNVVFRSGFNKPSVNNKSSKSRKYYYKNGGFLNYILRPDAVFKHDLSNEEIYRLNLLKKWKSKWI